MVNIDLVIDYQRKMFDKRMSIRYAKAHDYSDTTDILKSFRVVSEIINLLGIDPTTTYGVAMVQSIIKLQRLCNIIFSSKKPMNESLIDTFQDLKNYIDLVEECCIEEGVLDDNFA